MNVCKICRQDIRKGQMMAVLSFPVKCTAQSGDYSYFGDFSHNEQHIHHDCLREVASQLMEILCGNDDLKPKDITVEDEPEPDYSQLVVSEKGHVEPKINYARKLHQALKGLEVDTNIAEVTEFLEGHPDTPLEELIRVWFQEQDQVV